MDYWHRFQAFMDTAAIGGIGGVIAFLLRPKDKTITEPIPFREVVWAFFSFVISGGVISGFTSAQLMRSFGIDASSAGTISFLAGAIGGSLLTAILRSIDSMDIWPFIKSLIRAKLGIKEPPASDVSGEDSHVQ
ncbi:MAG TPA: hypothetical protein VK974_04650 [Methylophilaceae bacterium]|nr:hypothetical protein [Methylophilaceae bacterium]